MNQNATDKNSEDNNNDVFSVKCTYVQIYNEAVYDLLSADFHTQSQQFTNDKALKLRWSHEYGFFLEKSYKLEKIRSNLELE